MCDWLESVGCSQRQMIKHVKQEADSVSEQHLRVDQEAGWLQWTTVPAESPKGSAVRGKSLHRSGSFVLGRLQSQGVSRGCTNPNPPHKWQFSAVASPQTAQCEKIFTFPSVFSVVGQSMIVLKRTAGTSQPIDYVTYTWIHADHGVDIAWILQESIATMSVICHPHHHLNKPYLLCLAKSNKSVLTVHEDRLFWSFRNFLNFYTIRLYPG